MLGDISGKYESNNDVGAVSTGAGDLGGISYGAHQFIATVANAFANWLVQKGNSYGNMLAQYQAPSSGFSDMWRHIAKIDPEGFLALQHEYTKIKYYDVAEGLLQAENYHLEKHSMAMKECVFSRAVQYGPYYIVELFKEGLERLNPDYLNLSYVDDISFDKAIISSIYDFLTQECDEAYQVSNGLYHSPKDWANGSYDVVKIGLKNRFINEKQDLLNLLRSE